MELEAIIQMQPLCLMMSIEVFAIAIVNRLLLGDVPVRQCPQRDWMMTQLKHMFALLA